MKISLNAADEKPYNLKNNDEKETKRDSWAQLKREFNWRKLIHRQINDLEFKLRHLWYSSEIALLNFVLIFMWCSMIYSNWIEWLGMMNASSRAVEGCFEWFYEVCKLRFATPIFLKTSTKKICCNFFWHTIWPLPGWGHECVLTLMSERVGEIMCVTSTDLKTNLSHQNMIRVNSFSSNYPAHLID